MSNRPIRVFDADEDDEDDGEDYARFTRHSKEAEHTRLQNVIRACIAVAIPCLVLFIIIAVYAKVTR